MWEIESIDGFLRSFKKFAKAHRIESLNAISNSDSYLNALNSGLKPQRIERGFLHHEPLGIKAFDQNGPGAHKKETRLYAYPDEETETLYLILISGKDDQKRDIETCKQFVNRLLHDRKQSDEGDKNE